MNIRLNLYNDHKDDHQVNFTHETKNLFENYVYNNLNELIQTLFPYQRNIEVVICLFANYSTIGLTTRFSLDREMVHDLIEIYTIRQNFNVISAAKTRDDAILKLSHLIWDRANELEKQMNVGDLNVNDVA